MHLTNLPRTPKAPNRSPPYRTKPRVTASRPPPPALSIPLRDLRSIPFPGVVVGATDNCWRSSDVRPPKGRGRGSAPYRRTPRKQTRPNIYLPGTPTLGETKTRSETRHG